jgi:hypothetical protein
VDDDTSWRRSLGGYVLRLGRTPVIGDHQRVYLVARTIQLGIAERARVLDIRAALIVSMLYHVSSLET